MDNTIAKALIIVASVLVAMIVASFMVFSFRRIGTWASAADSEVVIEQTDKFNKEFEVYDKDLMYGVDVISCLNKALSNNEEISNSGIANGENVDAIYEVKVKVTLKPGTANALYESMEVYHMKYTGGKYIETKYDKDEAGASGVRLRDINFSFLKDTSASSYYTIASNFKDTDPLKTENHECKIRNTEFNLSKGGNAAGETEIRALLKTSSNMSEIIKNPARTQNDEDGWSKVVFRSALYDLKTRKFNCTKLDYNATTGRICNIEFEEF